MKFLSSVPLHEDQRERLAQIAPGIEILGGKEFIRSADELQEILDPGTEIIYATRVPRDVRERAPALKWLQLNSAGCDHLVRNGVAGSGLLITTVSGIHATPIAEYVLATILAFYRWLPQSLRGQFERRWIAQDEVARGARELRGRTVGVVGYGSIGREVARLVQPFGTRVLALKRDPGGRAETGYVVPGTGDPEGTIPEKFFAPGQLLDMLPLCDVVVLTVPLTDATRRMIGPAALEAMHERSFLVNITRGAVIDEAALIETLKAKKIAGAALDVFEREPLPQESELWGLENVMVTPHVSGASRPYQRRAFEVLAENLRRYTEGETLLNLFDPELGY